MSKIFHVIVVFFHLILDGLRLPLLMLCRLLELQHCFRWGSYGFHFDLLRFDGFIGLFHLLLQSVGLLVLFLEEAFVHCVVS